MQAIVQIIKVNEEKTGVKDGRPWAIQDCECLLLNDDGSPAQVGVLSLPKDLRGTVTKGIYTGSFSLQADLRSRRIEARLVGLQPRELPRPATASK